MRKLSRPWHGPYRVLTLDDPDITVVKVYYPQDGQIQVHQARVKPCPSFLRWILLVRLSSPRTWTTTEMD